jgi:cation diffusion facilitator CzcD-associated flavoprotein CzcO
MTGSAMRTDVLIVGAGPFGLSLAAAVQAAGLEHIVLGRMMAFWRERMPAGMFLRSDSGWHLDPTGEATIETFLALRGLTPAQAEPLPIGLYLDYVDWFADRRGITPLPRHVTRLEHDAGGFLATLRDGGTIRARRVVLATGLEHCAHVPQELAAMLPARHLLHTRDLVDFAAHRGRRVLIIGGRQSAFEWAALLNDAGADAVHLSHRHASPDFAASDWSWVPAVVDGMVEDPGWFRRLPPATREEYAQRLWVEGRLKVEPWLRERVMTPRTRLHPGTHLAACRERADGALDVTLDDGSELTVDQVVLASGYRPRAADFLSPGIIAALGSDDAPPALDEGFQTGVPGLYMTGIVASREFGPFFGFTVSARASAQIIARALGRPALAA